MKNLTTVLVTSLLSALLAIAIYRQVEEPREVIIREKPTAQYTKMHDVLFSGDMQRTFRSTAPTEFINSAESVTPAVVNIRAMEDQNFEFWGNSGFGGSSGSGVIISPDGYIVTNNHVIEDGDRFEVTLDDKRSYEAELIGMDKSTDLALLKVNDSNLPFVVFGNSDSLRVGEWVLAVGNPFNLKSTVTAGIISAKGRSINILEDQYSIESFIQTDAAVNPGNSGGALVNTNGELIGINTAIMTKSGKYEGYSFAIPANLARKVIDDLRDYGVVQRAILGVEISNISQEMVDNLDLPTLDGILIQRIYSNSGAEDAGLQVGDVITRINGIPVTSVPHLQEQVARHRPGNEISVEHYRGSTLMRTEIILKSKNNTTALLASRDYIMLAELGFELRELNRAEVRQLNTRGIKVLSISQGGPIHATNMDPGFIITKVNKNRVYTVEDVLGELKQAKSTVILEGIYENFHGNYYYTFEK